jgi:hypothetical protein
MVEKGFGLDGVIFLRASLKVSMDVDCLVCSFIKFQSRMDCGKYDF